MIDIDFPSGCCGVLAKKRAQRKPGLHVNTPALRGEFKPASSTGEIMTYPLDIIRRIKQALRRLICPTSLADRATRVIAADRSGREVA